MTKPTMGPEERGKVSARARSVRWLNEHGFTDGDSGSCSLIIDDLEVAFESAERAAADRAYEAIRVAFQEELKDEEHDEGSDNWGWNEKDYVAALDRAIRARKEEGG